MAASYPPPDSPYAFVPLDFERLDQREMVRRARAFYESMDRRRSVREFSPDPVPRELIDLAIATASTAPSGAHQQPWTWVVVGDAETKRVLREAVEREERENYEGGRIPVGYPSEPSLVPDLRRKSLAEVTAEPPPVERMRAERA